MLIYRILNNNAVLTKDDRHREMIILGKGIAFKKGMYDEIDESKITKKFLLASKQEKMNLETIIKHIPYEYFEFTESIRSYCEQQLQHFLDDGFTLRVADHIYFSVTKYHEDIRTPNLMLNEIQMFYRREFEISRTIIQWINDKFDVHFDENEAGFITFHIVSSSMSTTDLDMNEMLERLTFMIKYIEQYFHVTLDIQSLEYSRLVTHLKYFIQRMNYPSDRPSLKEDSLFLLLKDKFYDLYEFLIVFEHALQMKYSYTLSDSDQLYLLIHLARVLKRS